MVLFRSRRGNLEFGISSRRMSERASRRHRERPRRPRTQEVTRTSGRSAASKGAPACYPAREKKEFMNYTQALEILGTRDHKKVANNTYLRSEEHTSELQ